jgi:hypothetical protein
MSVPRILAPILTLLAALLFAGAAQANIPNETHIHKADCLGEVTREFGWRNHILVM